MLLIMMRRICGRETFERKLIAFAADANKDYESKIMKTRNIALYFMPSVKNRELIGMKFQKSCQRDGRADVSDSIESSRVSRRCPPQKRDDFHPNFVPASVGCFRLALVHVVMYLYNYAVASQQD